MSRIRPEHIKQMRRLVDIDGGINQLSDADREFYEDMRKDAEEAQDEIEDV